MDKYIFQLYHCIYSSTLKFAAFAPGRTLEQGAPLPLLLLYVLYMPITTVHTYPNVFVWQPGREPREEHMLSTA